MPAPTRVLLLLASLLASMLALPRAAGGCTGISLRADDGGHVFARTMEWSANAIPHDLIILPRGVELVGTTPEGENGLRWAGRYGAVGIAAYGLPMVTDGLNERGLSMGVFYLPGFAEYLPYDPGERERSLAIGDLGTWLLTNCATVEEVRSRLDEVRVVDVPPQEGVGEAALVFHLRVADASGAAIVIEYTNGGRLDVYDAFLGVITNSPTYDWHLTNLRNYLNLVPAPVAPFEIAGEVAAPLGAGSGMLGLPGDFTPPSRFVRAVAFVATARPLADAPDAVSEAFRILNNFDIPVGSTTAPGGVAFGVLGATQFTCASDVTHRRFYYHTQQNRRVRMVELDGIDFDGDVILRRPLDPAAREDIEVVTFATAGDDAAR